MARNQAAYATLNADHAGVVAAVLAEPGQVVSAGQPVLRIARDGEREVAIALPETAVTGLKPGMTAEISLWSGGRTYRGCGNSPRRPIRRPAPMRPRFPFLMLMPAWRWA
jgi:multidrug resistance efflux pump